MRKPICLLVIALLVHTCVSPTFLIAQTGEVAAASPAALSLLDGTPVRLRLGRTMGSKTAKTGETVDFEVLDDIKVGEIVVIARQSSAIATVTNAKPAGRLGKGGKLDINIDYVRLSTGEKIALRAVKGDKGDNRTGTMTTALVASGILFFPAAPLFLFIKGKNITIAKGTEVTAYVNGDFPIDASKFAANPIPAASDSTGVSVKSNPEGAEIEVDGQFVGSTPSAIQLKAGEHKITLKKTGFASWERTITVAAGSSITVDATLEKNP